MTRLIVWRHGHTSWNSERRFQGQTDVSLDEVGRAQAAAGAQVLASLRPDLLASSDLCRASDTADALATLAGVPVLSDSRLRERMYGEWEGMTHAEISARWPAQFERWRAGEPIPECGVEDSEDVAKRVGAALLDWAGRVGDGTLVVVSHNGAARQGIGVVLGWPVSVVRSLGPLGNCCWSELRRDSRGGWELHSHNAGPAQSQCCPSA